MIDSEDKIYSRDELVTLVEYLRAEGERIVCTNGVFDLMHVGHLRYLQAARSLGSILIVGLNSDASTRAIKGEKRPIVSQDERVEMLAGLTCVDLITIFDELTAEELVRAVRPDIYVKGGDYASDLPHNNMPAKPLPEAAIVRELGGRVEFIPYIPGRSTSELIAKIAATHTVQ